MAFSTLSSWALLVRDELHARGQDADAIFASAGLDMSELAKPGAREPLNNSLRALAFRQSRNRGALSKACRGTSRWRNEECAIA
jgi:hypothetical protein